MARKKQLISKIKPVNKSYLNQSFRNKVTMYQSYVLLNDNVKNSTAVKSIEKVIQSKVDVKNASLLEIFTVSFYLLEAGLIVEDEYRMLVNDHDLDRNQYQDFIDLWVKREQKLCRHKATEEEITKAHEIISILRFVDILRR